MNHLFEILQACAGFDHQTYHLLLPLNSMSALPLSYWLAGQELF
jgi:hypothetical protein